MKVFARVRSDLRLSEKDIPIIGGVNMNQDCQCLPSEYRNEIFEVVRLLPIKDEYFNTICCTVELLSNVVFMCNNLDLEYFE
jgi:hypothetical protein